MANICERCGRPRTAYNNTRVHRWGADPFYSCVAKAAVEHEYYGCDSGCCGHVVIGYDCDDVEVYREFHFDHPDNAENARVWATSFADHDLPGVTLDWAACEVSPA